MIKKPHYHVVAAVIKHNNEILCMQKGLTKFAYTSFKFEFPGGKVEPGETPQQALQREIREEMDYNISVGEKIATVEHEYPDFCITMEGFLCTVSDRKFTMREHHSYRWIEPENLNELDWAEADIPIAKKIATSL